MSARKLFCGIEGPVGITAEIAAHIGLPANVGNTHVPHITVQYFGALVTDADLDTIVHLWTDTLRAAKLNVLYDADITTTGKLALYGKEENQLVALCSASPLFHKAVQEARARVYAEMPHIPEGDFPFSPHITLGMTEVIPDSAVVPTKSFTFDKLFLWGDGGEVRATIAIPFDDT